MILIPLSKDVEKKLIFLWRLGQDFFDQAIVFGQLADRREATHKDGPVGIHGEHLFE